MAALKLAAKRPRGHQLNTQLSHTHRNAIKATQILKRLQTFCLSNLSTIDEAKNKRLGARGVLMTRTQVHVALALLRKVLPDLASVEVSGNPEKPLMVQVVRFSDGEQVLEPRPVLDMGKLIEMDCTEAAAIEAEVKPKAKRRAIGEKWLNVKVPPRG